MAFGSLIKPMLFEVGFEARQFGCLVKLVEVYLTLYGSELTVISWIPRLTLILTIL